LSHSYDEVTDRHGWESDLTVGEKIIFELKCVDRFANERYAGDRSVQLFRGHYTSTTVLQNVRS
jgi:hypothetical protein